MTIPMFPIPLILPIRQLLQPSSASTENHQCFGLTEKGGESVVIRTAVISALGLT